MQQAGAVLAAFCSLALIPSVAEGQSVAQGLSDLLTQQTPPPQGYVRDRAAAEATFGTVAALFQVELSNLPVVSSSGGFVYRFNPTFGTAERASDSFGPFFTERAVRNGRKNLSLSVAFDFASFASLQGADLTAGTFPTNTARFASQVLPFSVDTLSLAMEKKTVTGFASYGVSDRLDVGIAVPVTRLRFSGIRVNTFDGVSSLQSRQSGDALGFGDIGVHARYRLAGTAGTGVAVGTDVRFPTGREEDLLGAGQMTWRFSGIGSWERKRIALHANGGLGFGGFSREQFWSGAVTVAAGLRLSVVGEVIGRRLNELHRVSDVYSPHPVLAGVETMRWLPTDAGVHTVFLVTGVKWNVGQKALLNLHVLSRLTDTGLKARFTPALAVDYGFGF
ncbi:MAG: hypothetical protein H0W08_23375 [Acidobacteria bacterium]|nr:hypothetical protein [Acidobacteriota bacterium]